ncbi:MAG TPA: AAA family ATPase, partial [Candidatus Limnocylindrales bacterium]|nr:AAA family ATPase [Candidatus Limnocylindrales bacterium]
QITGAEHLWTDLERKRMFDSPTHSPAESKRLYTYLNQKAAHLLAQGKSVIFDTNFNFYQDRQLMRDMAARHGADCTLIWVQADPQLAYKRASENIEQQPTRVLGSMAAEAFERITNKLQPPEQSEQPIILDGTKITPAYVAEKLGIKYEQV